MPISVGGGEYFAGNDVFLPSKIAKSFKKTRNMSDISVKERDRMREIVF